MMDDSAPGEGKNADPEKTGAENFSPEKDAAKNSEIEKVKNEDMNSSPQENEDQNMNNASDKSGTDVASHSNKQQTSDDSQVQVSLSESEESNNENLSPLKGPGNNESQEPCVQNEKETKDTVV